MAFTCQATFAQKISADKVPAAAKDAFKAKFPQATDASWEIEMKDVYEVNFHNGKLKQAAQFAKDGKWQVTEVEVETTQVPKAVMDAFTKAYPGYKVKEVERLETPTQKEVYELEIIKGADKAEVQILPNGEIIKREANYKD
jgi:hypothetical protein